MTPGVVYCILYRLKKVDIRCKMQMDNMTDAHSDFSETSTLVLRQPVTCLCIC